MKEHPSADAPAEVTNPPGPGTPTAEDDAELVRRTRRGDLSAYDQLVRRYQERIYATIYHMTSNHADANDLAQDTFIKAFHALKSFKAVQFLHLALPDCRQSDDQFLKQRRHRTHLSLDNLDANAKNDPDLVAFVSEKTPRREVSLTELQEKLNEAMQQLSESHRLVVTLHDVQGLPHEKIAEILDCNVGTVRSRLFYARQQLQGFLSEYLK